MKTPLDDELADGQAQPAKLTQKTVLKANIYLLLMIVGQAGVEYGLTRVLNVHSLPYVLKSLSVPLMISAGLELFRWGRHRWREQKAGQQIPRDPFWFQVIEGGFAIWLLIEVLPVLLRTFVF